MDRNGSHHRVGRQREYGGTCLGKRFLNREDQLIFAFFSFRTGPGQLTPSSRFLLRQFPRSARYQRNGHLLFLPVDFGKRRIYDKGRAGILRNIDLLVSPQRRVGQRNARFAREKPRPVSFDLEIERVFHRLGLRFHLRNPLLRFRRDIHLVLDVADQRHFDDLLFIRQILELVNLGRQFVLRRHRNLVNFRSGTGMHHDVDRTILESLVLGSRNGNFIVSCAAAHRRYGAPIFLNRPFRIVDGNGPSFGPACNREGHFRRAPRSDRRRFPFRIVTLPESRSPQDE